MADMIPIPKGLQPHGNFNRDRKGDKEPIALAGEQYQELPESQNIEDRRGENMSDVEAASHVAASRTRDGVRGRYRPSQDDGV